MNASSIHRAVAILLHRADTILLHHATNILLFVPKKDRIEVVEIKDPPGAWSFESWNLILELASSQQSEYK